MYADAMPLDSTFREITQHGSSGFPIQFYVDELYKFQGKCVPFHWHAEPEFFVIKGGDVGIRIGDKNITLRDGEGIFINSNVLHRFAQLNEDDYCQCPNIVFNPEIIAPVSSTIYQAYIKPVIFNATLPYVVLLPQISWQAAMLKKLNYIFALLHTCGSEGAYGPLPAIDYRISDLSPFCYEMQVQNLLNGLWQWLFNHLNDIPKIASNKKELQRQVRLQQMLSFIQKNYPGPITLQEISRAANISKSEAGRCFHIYLNCSPVDYLLNYRVEMAQKFLQNSSLNISEISQNCGFHSQSYFTKIFKRKTGLTPGHYRMA